MEQRENHLKLAELCKKRSPIALLTNCHSARELKSTCRRLLWIDFQDAQTEAKALKENKEAAERVLRDAEGSLDPLKEKVSYFIFM